MSTNRLYIDSIICGDKSELLPYEKDFNLLLTGHTKSVDLKRIGHARKNPLYRICLGHDKAGRALLSTVTINGKKRWVLLKIFTDHKYERLNELKKGGLQAFFDANSEWLNQEDRLLTADDFE